MGTQKLMGLIGGIVVTLIALAFFGPLTGAANNLYLQFTEHCEVDGDPTLALRNIPTPEDGMVTLPVEQYSAGAFVWGTSDAYGFQQSKCTIGRSAVPVQWLQGANYAQGASTLPSEIQAGTLPDGTDWRVFNYLAGGTKATYMMEWEGYTEDGLQVQIATPLCGENKPPLECTTTDVFTFPNVINNFPIAGSGQPGDWLRAAEITKRFQAINKLIISLMPLMLVISFLAATWGSLYEYSQSPDGGIRDAIAWETRTLIILMITVYMAPVFLEFAGGAALVSSSGAYQATKQFGAITTLLFSLLPLIFTLGVIGVMVVRGVKTFKSIKGNMG